MKPEQLLTKRIANHLLEEHNKVPFRIDLAADMPLPPHLAKRLKELHGKWSRGHPDLLLMTMRDGYGGLYLELKATDNVPDTEHTRRQASYHAVLRFNGYKVSFCCGLEDCKGQIDAYLKRKLTIRKVKIKKLKSE